MRSIGAEAREATMQCVTFRATVSHSSNLLSSFIARIFIFLLNSFVEVLNAVLVHFGPYYTARFVHCSTSELLFNTF